MTEFAVIGAGPMGRALTERFSRAGITVAIADRHEERARHAAALQSGTGRILACAVEEAVSADVVFLAIWYPDTIAFAARWADELADTVLVDMANPLDDSYTHLTVPESASAAEHLAQRLPHTHIVKAFNTATASSLAGGCVERTTLDVFVAADEEAPKARVMQVVDRLGLRALDAGALENARLLERLAAFGIEIGQRYGFGFGFGFKFLPDTPYLIACDTEWSQAATA